MDSFWIDVKTPVEVTYSTIRYQGQVVRTFKWSAVMYSGDVLGTQPGDPIFRVNQIPGVERLCAYLISTI